MSFRYCVVSAVVAAACLLSCRPADQGLPSITITDPVPHSVVPGIVRVHVFAVSHHGIVSTSLYVDDSWRAEAYPLQDSAFVFIWDGTGERGGSQHRLQAVVEDSAGNTARSDAVVVTMFSPSGPTIHTGNITSDETWPALASPHVVRGTVDVGAVLTIESGAEVRFEPGAELQVGETQTGALVARGGASLITFTSDASSPQPGDWSGIRFGPEAEEGLTTLDNCLVEYGGSDLACVMTDSCRIRMTNCVVRQSAGYGVSCGTGGFLAFSDNVLIENRKSGLVIDPLRLTTVGAGNRLIDNAVDGIAIRPLLIAGDARWPNLGIPYFLDDRSEIGHR